MGRINAVFYLILKGKKEEKCVSGTTYNVAKRELIKKQKEQI